MDAVKKCGLVLLGVAFAMSGGASSLRSGLMGSAAYAFADPEDDLDDDIEDDVEDDIEDDIESDIEDDIEEDVEADIEDGIESDIEDAIEADLESDIEDDVEDDVEDDIESDIEDDIEDDVEDDIEDDIEDDVEDDAEDDLEDELEDDAEDDFDDDDFDDDDDSDFDDDDFDDDDDDDDDEDRAAAETALFEIAFDDENQEIRAGESIVLISPEVVSVLDARGYSALEIEELDGIDLVLARIETPQGFDLAEEAAAIAAADPNGQIDFNHLYRTQQTPPNAPSAPSASFALEAVEAANGLRLGLIDTLVDKNHGALRAQRIRTKDFIDTGGARPTKHGTSIASILVGNSQDYAGLLPAAELYAASVFDEHPGTGAVASAASLVLALNWMALNDVAVVNMSLAGPPNGVLQAAIDAVSKQGIIVVAAAGNKGPAAKPLYPAAYDSVIAITAVNDKNSVYRLAGRGAHIDFAAPGVGIVAANPEGGYSLETGTSMAAPFATAVVALQCAGEGVCADRRAVIDALSDRIIDLGPDGHDTIYGYGLLQP